jgi:2-keto-3-deoxy-galactonokinase
MVDRKVVCSILPLPDTEHQDEHEMSQAEYAAVDWGTSSFRLWLIDRAGGVLQERRSQEGMMAAAKLGFAAVLQSHLDNVGAANDLPVVVCGMAGARQGWSRLDTSTRRRISHSS